MKKSKKFFGIITIVVIIGFVLSACEKPDDPKCPPHTWGGDYVTAPTCINGGHTTQWCSWCIETQKIKQTTAAGHNWGNNAVTSPTCTEEGYTTQTCSNCLTTQKINQTAALEHDWNTVSETIREGVQGKKCNRIGCNKITDYKFTYAVGEKGPGGGTIIYVGIGLYSTTIADSSTAYYREAAPTYEGSLNNRWYDWYDAKWRAGRSTYGGKNDWYLPNDSELRRMLTVLDLDGSYYWTSSEIDKDYAWVVAREGGQIFVNRSVKANLWCVRAVRAF